MEIDPEEIEIGREFIIEAEAEEFLDKKLYFVCLLCENSTQKHSELNQHLVSISHRLKFLVSFG